MTQPIWQTSRFAIDLTQPKVMGIVNLTPDSFSDGGRYSSLSIALENAQTLLGESLLGPVQSPSASKKS